MVMMMMTLVKCLKRPKRCYRGAGYTVSDTVLVNNGYLKEICIGVARSTVTHRMSAGRLLRVREAE